MTEVTLNPSALTALIFLSTMIGVGLWASNGSFANFAVGIRRLMSNAGMPGLGGNIIEANDGERSLYVGPVRPIVMAPPAPVYIIGAGGLLAQPQPAPIYFPPAAQQQAPQNLPGGGLNLWQTAAGAGAQFFIDAPQGGDVEYHTGLGWGGRFTRLPAGGRITLNVVAAGAPTPAGSVAVGTVVTARINGGTPATFTVL